MANRLVTALTAITGVNTATGDLFILEDISDTTDDAGGTVKKITRAELVNAIRAAAGMTPTRQILTVGSGTYTTPSGCTMIVVEVIGAGGAGGGVTGSATQAGGGGGGGSGAYASKLIVTPAGNYAYTAGAKGSGSAGGAGGNGANSTFGAGGSLITAPGGTGGPASGTGTTININQGGAGGVVATGGDINCGGTDGATGARWAATQAVGGAGGSSILGGGGTEQFSGNTAGNNATAYGAGGGGGQVASVNTARAGGNGLDGAIIVMEFYT